MSRPRLLPALALVAALVLLASCAASGNPEAGGPGAQPGFLYGLWHGLITPVTFVVSLFTDGVGIYEVDNSGGWYDFGYVLGLSVVFGGGVGGASRR